MKNLFILPLLLFWVSSFGQTINESYKSEPRFAYGDSQGKVHLYNQYYQVRPDYIMHGNPRLQHLTFNADGALVDSVMYTLGNENETFRLSDGYAYSDTIILIGGKVTKGQPQTWQFRLAKHLGNQLIKDTTFQFHSGVDSCDYRLEGYLINSRGNMVCLISNANYNQEPEYYSKYHFFEIDMQSLTLEQYVEVVLDDIPHSFMFFATNIAENRATNELWISTGNLETLIFDASTFTFKQFVDQRYDRWFMNPILPIPGDTSGKMVTVAGWRNVDYNGVIPSDWLDRGDEACIYVVNKDLTVDTAIYFETELREMACAPWANNFAVTDTGNIWLAMSAYEYPTVPLFLDDNNSFSEVNVWKTGVTGNIECQSTWFANQTEKNYTPWQVVPTNDGGVMIFGTVNPFVNNSTGSRTKLFYLKLNNNCELTSIKEWSVNNYHSLEVYPNPVQNELHIKLDGNVEFSGFIFNASGQQVKEFTTAKVDVSDLPAGAYVVELQSKKHSRLTTQFIKE
jgi:hypothetical protein